MSDNLIALIPDDPLYVPGAAQQSRALDRFRELVPNAEEIESKLNDRIQLFDCGANLERITCPSCRSEIPIDWWQARMDEDFEHGGFRLAQYPSPCCNAAHTLQELIYDWPQAFGRFAIVAMNPNTGKLQDRELAEFERLLGSRLRVVYQHI